MRAGDREDMSRGLMTERGHVTRADDREDMS